MPDTSEFERMSAHPNVVSLRLYRYPSSIGIGHRRPTLTWRFDQDSTTIPEWIQTVYEISITRRVAGEARESRYKVESSVNVEVEWPADEKDLSSSKIFSVAVRVSGVSQRESFRANVPRIWSDWCGQKFHAALLEQDDWTSDFITSTSAVSVNLPRRPFTCGRSFMCMTRTGGSACPVFKQKPQEITSYISTGISSARTYWHPGWHPY